MGWSTNVGRTYTEEPACILKLFLTCRSWCRLSVLDQTCGCEEQDSLAKVTKLHVPVWSTFVAHLLPPFPFVPSHAAFPFVLLCFISRVFSLFYLSFPLSLICRFYYLSILLSQSPFSLISALLYRLIWVACLLLLLTSMHMRCFGPYACSLPLFYPVVRFTSLCIAPWSPISYAWMT